MVNSVEAARLLWCIGLSQTEGRAIGAFSDWIGIATFAPRVVDEKIVMSGVDNRVLLEKIAGDINRIAIAARETIENIESSASLPKSLAWAHVKLYYAALFYSHVLLRIWGRFPTYFKTSDLLPLRAALDGYSIKAPWKIKTGQYLVRIDTRNALVEISQDRGGDGTHEAVWRELQRALIDFRAAVSTAPFVAADRLRIELEISNLISLMSNNLSNISWLSAMRNNIQYRQSDGIWFPYESKLQAKIICGDIYRVICDNKNLTSNAKKKVDSLFNFRFACISLINYVRGVLLDLSQVAGSKGFLQYGHNRLEALVARSSRAR